MIEKAFIYRIVCNITNRVYIGSTTKTIEQRLKRHEQSYKQYLNKTYSYVSSYEILKEGNYRIESIEELHNLTRKQLLLRERLNIESNECLNKVKRPSRTEEETKAYKKVYREVNKDKIKECKGRICICDCGKQYTHDHKSRHERCKVHQDYIKSLNK